MRDNGEHAEADADRVDVGFTEMPRQRGDAVEHRSARLRQPEHAGHLRNQDVHGDAGEKARRHRRRQQIGDPAQPEQAAGDEDHADQQRQRHRERLIVWRTGGGHQHQAAGEDRRDRGIGAAGQEAVAAEHGKTDRSRDEGEEADLRREAAEPRRRHLFGDRDRRQRQARDQIARQIAARNRAASGRSAIGLRSLRAGPGHRSLAPCCRRLVRKYSPIVRQKASRGGRASISWRAPP